MKKILLVGAALFLSACTSLQTVSLTSVPPKRDRPIRSEASRVIFLGLNFDNDYVDQLTTDLKRQCQDGIISGILTKDEIVDYFLMLVHKRRVTATAYCNKAGAGKVSQQSNKPRRPTSEEETEAPSTELDTPGPGYIE
jgi:hypothetical protein